MFEGAMNIVKVHKNFLSTAKSIGRGSALINYLDILQSAVFFGASHNNYIDFGFKGKAFSQRKDYFTYRDNQRLMRKMNDAEAIKVFKDKYRFDVIYHDLIGRGFCLPSQLLEKLGSDMQSDYFV